MGTVATDYGGVSVLTVRDELAGDAVEAFSNEVSHCIERRRFDIVLDCGALVQVDSVGLEALLDLWERCEAGSGAVRLCNVDHVFVKVLEITRLSRRFEVFDDLESAVQSFN